MTCSTRRHDHSSCLESLLSRFIYDDLIEAVCTLCALHSTTSVCNGHNSRSGSSKTLVEIQKQGEVQGKKTEEEETPRETVESSVQWTRDGFLRDQKAENWSLWNQEIISEESSIKNLRHM